MVTELYTSTQDKPSLDRGKINSAFSLKNIKPITMIPIFIFTFLIALFKGGILIGTGILLRHHFVTVVSLIRRKELPDNFIWLSDDKRAMTVIRTIDLLITLTGIAEILMRLASLNDALSMPRGNFNFNF